MAVFRVEHTCNYTVMSNYHLRSKQLSLKAKGLLAMILSLPDDWNYSVRGLAAICKDGVDAIGAAVRELEASGYIVRTHKRGRGGRIKDIEYSIYEEPICLKQGDIDASDVLYQAENKPETVCPGMDLPCTGNPYPDGACTEKPAELNIDRSNTNQ